jgi:hypothetical protein
MVLFMAVAVAKGEGLREKNGPALAGHGAAAVRDAITRTITTLPEALRRSLTWDQGAEMAQHTRLRIDTGFAGVFLRSAKSMAKRDEREHQWAAASVLPEGDRPERTRRR